MTQVGITSPSLNLFIIFHKKKPHQRLTLYYVLGKKCFLSYGMCFQMDIVCAFRVLWSHPPWTTPCQCSQRTSWAPWRSRWTIFPWGQQERWVEEFAFVSWDLRRCHVLSSLALPISCSSRTPCGFQHEWACMQVQSQGTHIHMGKGEVLWHGL